MFVLWGILTAPQAAEHIMNIRYSWQDNEVDFVDFQQLLHSLKKSSRITCQEVLARSKRLVTSLQRELIATTQSIIVSRCHNLMKTVRDLSIRQHFALTHSPNRS